MRVGVGAWRMVDRVKVEFKVAGRTSQDTAVHLQQVLVLKSLDAARAVIRACMFLSRWKRGLRLCAFTIGVGHTYLLRLTTSLLVVGATTADQATCFQTGEICSSRRSRKNASTATAERLGRRLEKSIDRQVATFGLLSLYFEHIYIS